MNLNHLQLPAAVIAELYPASLIEKGEAMVAPGGPAPSTIEDSIEQKDVPPTFKWLGENKKNILVVVNYPGTIHLPDAALQFLTSVLGACQLSMGDVAVLNLASQPVQEYAAINAVLKPRVTILFAIEPAAFGLPMNFPFFQLQAFARSTFLYAPALNELEEDKVLKSKLWVCLKRLFNV